MERKLTPNTVAELMSVSKSYVSRLIGSGELQAENVAAAGKPPRYQVCYSELLRFIESLSDRPRQPAIKRRKQRAVAKHVQYV